MAFQGTTMPGPYLGLDLVSPIDNMDPATALKLINIFPGANSPALRAGYESFATVGSGTPITFLQSLNLADGSSRLIAGNSSALFSVTTSGTPTTITGSTVTNGEWQSTTYNNRIYLCNGVDSARSWDGIAATTSNLTFTGLALTSMIGVHAHKERLYFIEKNSCKIWYGGVQVTGTGGSPALTSFDLSYVMTRGGFVVALGSYSNTTSMTSQDYFWACSSEGEIVFYTGTYAGDPTTWGLVARYYIGRPLGRRAFVRVNNDVWIVTEQGIVPISGLFQSDPEAALNILSRRINPLISEAAKLFPFNYAWSGFFWPQGRAVYFAIPVSTVGCHLLVYAIDQKAWTLFQLYDDSHCLSSCLFNKLPFYGSNQGRIWKGETGPADARIGSIDQYISFDCTLPYSFYQTRNNYKTFKDIRAIIQAAPTIKVGIVLDTDFRPVQTLVKPISSSTVLTTWGSPWGSPWSGASVASGSYSFDRYSLKGQGHAASIRFGGFVKTQNLQILGFEVRYEIGGQV
jgi:hypothetical protein